jgi:hypothetical protein
MSYQIFEPQTSQLRTEEESRKMVHLEYSFIWCLNLDASDSRSKHLESLKCGAGEGLIRSVLPMM